MTGLDARIVAKISPDASSGCWIWTGGMTRNGYGLYGAASHGGQLAHRRIYEMLVGPIPDGLELDHTCRVAACVNPDHLEPVTHAENMRRARKPLCGRGLHDLDDPANLHPSSRRKGLRICKPCAAKARLAYQREWRRRRKAA